MAEISIPRAAIALNDRTGNRSAIAPVFQPAPWLSQVEKSRPAPALWDRGCFRMRWELGALAQRNASGRRKLMIVKKRGPSAPSAPSPSYLRYTE